MTDSTDRARMECLPPRTGPPASTRRTCTRQQRPPAPRDTDESAARSGRASRRCSNGPSSARHDRRCRYAFFWHAYRPRNRIGAAVGRTSSWPLWKMDAVERAVIWVNPAELSGITVEWVRRWSNAGPAISHGRGDGRRGRASRSKGLTADPLRVPYYSLARASAAGVPFRRSIAWTPCQYVDRPMCRIPGKRSPNALPSRM
jgi:hypothetical protein